VRLRLSDNYSTIDIYLYLLMSKVVHTCDLTLQTHFHFQWLIKVSAKKVEKYL